MCKLTLGCLHYHGVVESIKKSLTSIWNVSNALLTHDEILEFEKLAYARLPGMIY